MRRLGLTLALGGLLVVVDTTVTVVAVPALVTGLHATLTEVQWVTTAYLLGIVAVIPLAGWSASRFGARRVYLVALGVFTLCSLLAGLAWNVAALAVFRALQGIGGGLLNPVGQAIGLRAVPRSHRGRLMSLLALPLIIGPVCGPPLAGWLIASASWRWIFLINIPLGVVAVIASARILPADPARAPREPVERIDWAGLLLLSGGAVLIVLGGTLLDHTWHGITVLLTGLTMAGLFARRALRPAGPVTPLVDLRLLSRRPFRGGTAVMVCFSAAYFGSMVLLPLYAQGVRGDSAAVVGALSLPQAIAVGLTAQVASRLTDRVPPHRIVVAGTATGLAGAVGLLAATWADAGYPLLLAATVLVGVGSGGTLMPAMILVMRDLDGADTPRATTLLNLLQRLAAAVGTAAVAVTANLLLARDLPGGAASMMALSAEARELHRPTLSTAMALTYVPAVTLIAAALFVALRSLRPPSGHPPESRPVAEEVTRAHP
ncbi:MFS transporter [Actinoplanes cyaneus]|uniref:MFS transporter n=1 Tax=Actinoplanes cyaneus TaxID=52696 RepID=A0A919M757_9ACTN|nr:DHA2 family efflux MFS transporter permease subunit [Actinoplanes cyaneus]MCW2137704.1 drug resistance transporter, EmrB/QacA subfamily [Actinoplanes cyaneus]GID65089.1 MFS transporter [Actinoplanes cyaneus]